MYIYEYTEYFYNLFDDDIIYKSIEILNKYVIIFCCTKLKSHSNLYKKVITPDLIVNC